MHLIGRNKESSARLQFVRRGEQRGLPDVAQQHVRLLHLIERRGEGAGDRFLDQSFAQSDPQIAGQNFHHVLAFPRGKFRQLRLQNLGFRDRAARLLQRSKSRLDSTSVNGSGVGPSFERFERSLARVAVAAADAVQFRVAQSRGAQERER